MDMRMFHAVNSTVNGHLLVAWAMGLNALAWRYGTVWCGALGVMCGAVALVSAHYTSGFIMQGRNAPVWIYFAIMGFTALAWLLWLVPALLS